MADMKDMFAQEGGAPPEPGMKVAQEMDVAVDEAMTSASPTVTIKARTVKALSDALNKALPLFEAPPVEVEAVDLKDEPLPVEIIRALQMINAAYNDYAGEDAIDITAFETDSGALIEIAKLGKAVSDKKFAKFLSTPETKGTEAKEETTEEPEMEDTSEEDMMMRMG